MQPPHSQVTELEAETQRKSREVVRLQARGAQDAQQRQQSRQEALELQRLAVEAEAAREGAQREVGAQHPASGLTGATALSWGPGCLCPQLCASWGASGASIYSQVQASI